ncbi:MAG: hypothetical protein KDJ72_12385 [Methyloceanibacter sp.]|uniref:hypothetical protein n=1 Tax=Methyloceanibacter sp. TaxID=1965321 RepID=UPI001D31214F|nr:hypothetical protein [Methyloceanibacter sp.]MCB1443809.1 hypothetical protein [Methyloceanibacter sp.]MCC0058211.1 hypothetical protein [Hyphomicrobiaceae bacterium]
MNAESAPGAGSQTVPWWVAPGETDTAAFAALFLLFLIVFAVFHFYARFDRYAERHNEGTPLKTTVPMLLMVAFAYEIFPPLRHFSILLPMALIATALARDLMLWFEPRKEHAIIGELEDRLAEELEHERDERHQKETAAAPASKSEPEPKPKPKPKAVANQPAPSGIADTPAAAKSDKVSDPAPKRGEGKDD